MITYTNFQDKIRKTCEKGQNKLELKNYYYCTHLLLLTNHVLDFRK